MPRSVAASVPAAAPAPADAGATALDDTRRWLERAVIGLNLCPFARAVHRRRAIRWVASAARTPHALATELAAELLYLAAADPARVETTLIVAPGTLRRFADFNRFLGLADELLHALRLNGVLQIAAFHPRWRFADAPAADPAHASNRAPHPTLHLLREDGVAQAVAAFPQAEAIYGRNVALLRALGTAGLDQLLHAGTAAEAARLARRARALVDAPPGARGAR
jgi:hypothetical protein